MPIGRVADWEPETRRPQAEADERKQAMPVLSKFYGIVIRMLFSRGLPARFHAFYEGHELVVEVFPLRIVGGEAPQRVANLVLRWAHAHQRELIDAWQRCRAAQRPLPIAPWNAI